MNFSFLQKTGALFSALALIFSSGILFPELFSSSVSANGSWTREKATHLAYRGLISPSQEDIDALFAAGSADDAVELLFADPSAQEQSEYDSILDEFKDSEYYYDPTNAVDFQNLHLLKLWKNPDQAREKLFLLFDDIFSTTIGVPRQVLEESYDWRNTIYQSLDGSYQELVKRTMREWGQGFYLHLFNGNKNSPNQDFAREFLQLFLMEELPPVAGLSNIELEANGKNYTEEDMIAMSFLLTGYRGNGGNVILRPMQYFINQLKANAVGYLQGVDENTLTPGKFVIMGKKNVRVYQYGKNEYEDITIEEGLKVSIEKEDGTIKEITVPNYKDIYFEKPDGRASLVYFDRSYHNTTPQTLFGESVSVPEGKDPAAVVVPYVFEKKKEAIANFIGWKLINHYVNTVPTASEVTVAANILKANDFHILNSVKAILKNDIMYSQESMNEFRYKSSVEAYIGILKKLDLDWHTIRVTKDNKKINYILSSFLPTQFSPLRAPSIFGRDEMDDNSLWMNDYRYGQWQGNVMQHGMYRLLNILMTPEERSPLKIQVGESIDDYLERLIVFTIPGKTLPVERKEKIKAFFTQMEIGSEMTDGELTRVLRLLFSQPEYLLLSGENTDPEFVEEKDPYENDHVVIYEWWNGAPDEQHLLIPTHDTNYNLIKGDLKVLPKYTSPLVDKNGETNQFYRANTNAMGEKMLQYYREGKLHIFQGVAEVGQTQSHYAARQTAETGGLENPEGYLTKILQDVIAPGQLQALVESHLFRGMPASTLFLGRLPKLDVLNVLSDTPDTIPGKFASIVPAVISNIELLAKKDNNDDYIYFNSDDANKNRLDYFSALVEEKNAIALTSRGQKPFDSHQDLAPYLLDENTGKQNPSTDKGFENHFQASFGRYTETLERFKEKYPEKDLSIVIYGEFGRTTVPNKTNGNDHGRGGLFMVLSTDDTLFDGLPQLMGRPNTNDNDLNYQTVNIDRKSIWDEFFQHVYSTDLDKRKELFGDDLPLPLEVYAKMDALYDNIYAARSFDYSKVLESLAVIEELKTTISGQNFETNYFLKRLDQINNHFARVLSFPAQGKSLFSQFSFENTLGDSDYNPQHLKILGDATPSYEPGMSGNAILLDDGVEYNNDRYGTYTPQLANDESLSEDGNSIFFWMSPKELRSKEVTIFENVAMGVKVSLTTTGTEGGKKLKIQYVDNNKIVPVLTESDTDNKELHVGQWVQVGIISNIAEKNISITLDGNKVAELDNPTNFKNNYRYRFGVSTQQQPAHSVLIDEFTSYGKVFSPEEAKAKYVEDRLLLTDISQEESTLLVETLLESNADKERLKKVAKYRQLEDTPKNMTGVGKQIARCLQNGTSGELDGEIKLLWNGNTIADDEIANSAGVFLEGVSKNAIDFSYDKPSTTYTMKMNPKDEQVLQCYFAKNSFFTTYFTLVN